MNLKNLTVEIPAPPSTVFDYLSDIDNFPAWATEFCHEMWREDGHYKVRSPLGELYLEIKAHRDSGAVDVLATSKPNDSNGDALPTRLVNSPTGGTYFVVNFVQPPEVDAKTFALQCSSLEKEMNNVRRHFITNPAVNA